MMLLLELEMGNSGRLIKATKRKLVNNKQKKVGLRM